MDRRLRTLAVWPATGAACLFFLSPQALALPSYARQTGDDCSACHVSAFGPQLTPHGTAFKLHAYAESTGDWTPPVSAMAVVSYLSTRADNPASDGRENGNFKMDELGIFLAGKLAGPVGAFAQLTYDGPGHVWGLDNVDLRVAFDTEIDGAEAVFGASLNNNPGVQDPWNTFGPWRYPFNDSAFAIESAAAPLIEGGLEEQVVGATAFVMYDNMFYLEAGAYASPSDGYLDSTGIAPDEAAKLDGAAFYARFGVQKDWGKQNAHGGLALLTASLFPERDSSLPADDYTDLVIDGGYQWLGSRKHIVNVQGAYIYEWRNLHGSYDIGAAERASNELQSFHLDARADEVIAEHVARLQEVRAAASDVGRHIAVLADLPGPKVRSGPFPSGGALLVEGAEVLLVPGEGPSTAERVVVEYPSLLEDLAVGDRIVVGDGAISLRVQGVGPQGASCQILTGGRVQARPGIHLPSERLRLRTPTAEDLELATVMAEAGADFLAVSFVRAGVDLDVVRRHLGDGCPRLVAKIETSPAIAALDDILEAADAVMVARGDLGIECPAEDVPHLQKQIIRACVEAGIPVITATQMLESMITAPSPTRAEVSDVANAVFDGTDAVMLSAETAVGHDPVLVVKTMATITARAEREANYGQWASRLGRIQRRHWPDGPERITLAITHAAWQAAEDVQVAAILCCTRSGRTARTMSRFRPEAELVGLSHDLATARSLALLWGVRPLVIDEYTTSDDLVWFAVERTVQAGLVPPGEHVLVLAGAPDRAAAATDILRIVRVE